MCTTKKKKKDKKSSTPSPKKSKKPKTSKDKSKSKEETVKKEEIPKLEKKEPVPVQLVPVKPVPPPQVVNLDVKRMSEMKTQPEPTLVGKSVKKRTKSMKVETTGKTSEETQQSQTIRTEMLENAQCNPFPIDLKKVFNVQQKKPTETTKFAENSDIDSDSTLAGIYSDFEGLSLPKLVQNSCPPEKKRTTTKRPKGKPNKSSPNRSLDTQRSD